MFDALSPRPDGAALTSPAIRVRQSLSGALVIPARNEARRISACLDALCPQASAADCAIVVVVNGTTDDTARIARSILARLPRATGTVIELGATPLPHGVGQARALGFHHARQHHAPAALLSTDADCLAAPDWLAQNLAALTEVDVNFGRVLPQADELARLAPLVHRHGDIESLYMQAAVRLAARLDPRRHDRAPAHRTASGASLAFRASVHDIIGFPAVALNEDRAFARSAEFHDLKVRYCGKATVHASCRLEGRATGGMADTLRARCGTDDPYCDDWLEPADTFALRHGLRGRLRRAWPDTGRMTRELRRAGLSPDTLPARLTARPDCGFGAFWAGLEARLPELTRRRVRFSEAARELPRLRELLARAEQGAEAASRVGAEAISA
jgi:cellulose synthase/poly-beta-1,6-N-acetylglucosamine synthase-like glycosyltransferase